MGFPYAGLPVLRIKPRRTSSYQCPAPHGDGDPAFPGAAADDWRALAQRVCGGGVCDSSVAGGIGGVGGGTQGRAQRHIFHADHRGVCAVCPKTVESRESRVETQTASALDPRPWTLDYYLVLLFFALGLMCKPMLVTLPFVLLLLDYWPLGRFSSFKLSSFKSRNCPQPSTLDSQRLILEKLPLFGLAAASCVVTLFAQTKAIQPFEQISLPLRVGNALISYVAYLGQMFWPSGLAVFYPFTAGGVGVSGVVLSLVVLAGISAGVFVLRRRPLFFDWLAVVSHHAGAGDWDCSGGSAGAGGSLHLSAADRLVSVADMGGGGSVRWLASPPRGAGRLLHDHPRCFDFLRAHPDFLLAE